ncbi:MAG: iron-containing alcohol dehydrogenase [Balneolales bacterium]
MKISTVNLPRSIYYGKGSLDKIGEVSAQLGRKALIVSDYIMEKLGYLDTCCSLLKTSGVDFETYLDVASEPLDHYVQEALERAKTGNCDVIIGLGGGSCLDTAKAVAVLATNPGYIGDYINLKKLAKNNPLPLIAIPTTAGTGSEATDVTVITNTGNSVKMMIKQPAFMPEIAIVDPVLTITSPKQTTAATGVDALTHAVEAYISRKAHPFTDQLALSAIKLIMGNLPEAYHNGENMEARNNMIYASMLAGIAFSNSSVCLVHGMSRPIGALFHVPHGISNAMLLPVVLNYTKDECHNRLAQIGRYLAPEKTGASDELISEELVSKIIALCRELNIPNIKTWGVNETDFSDKLNKMAKDALASGSPENNPKIPTEEEIISLYQESYTFQYPEAKKT